ncbi:MAG: YqeG family HAD IIIA-type phosphatase [Acutalibacteraceae bacterium]|nr:YqeG family HAD IIIA-type phosphatase [Acutalibacteraceae bacterium]
MFKPHFIKNSITDISVEFLKQNNISALLLDVDNTMSVAHANKTLRPGLGEWMQLMKENGITLMILSNAKTPRAKLFAQSVGLSVIGMAAKPLPFGYLKAARTLDLPKKHIAMVGDQIFTDVLGGNISGVKTIWVTDITPEDKTFFKIKRYFERIMLKRWQK